MTKMMEKDLISYDSQTDEQLAELCRKEDRLAFQELMNRYLRQIFNFVRQYSRITEDIDDITQDTFFKVWKHIKQFKKGKRFKPWIYTIARNTALDFIKKKKSVSFSELDDTDNDLSFAETIADTEPLPMDIFDNKATAKKLSEKLELLKPDYRSVLILHYNEDLTFEEISAILDKPMNTVKSWHRRAMVQLRELYKDIKPPHQ